MTSETQAENGVVKQTTNSLLEVALPVDAPPNVRKVGSGQQLAQARASAGVSVEALAARLRLSTAQVLALDAERWEQLPDLAFVRAALRAYARQVDVDVKPLIDHVGGYGEPTILEPTASVEAVAKGAGRAAGLRQGGGGWTARLAAYRWPVAALGAVLLLVLIIVLSAGLGEQQGTTRVQSVPIPGVSLPGTGEAGQMRPAINPTNRIPGAGGSPSVRDSTPTIGTGGSIIRLSPDPVTIRGVAPVPPGSVTPESARSAAEAGAPVAGVDGRVRVAGATTVFPVQMPDSEPVHVHIKKRAWIDITHKDGVKLLSGTQDANQSFKLDGTPPMQVQIGNPAGVAIEFRGRLIDLSSKTNEKGVASFTLN